MDRTPKEIKTQEAIQKIEEQIKEEIENMRRAKSQIQQEQKKDDVNQINDNGSSIDKSYAFKDVDVSVISSLPEIKDRMDFPEPKKPVLYLPRPLSHEPLFSSDTIRTSLKFPQKSIDKTEDTLMKRIEALSSAYCNLCGDIKHLIAENNEKFTFLLGKISVLTERTVFLEKIEDKLEKQLKATQEQNDLLKYMLSEMSQGYNPPPSAAALSQPPLSSNNQFPFASVRPLAAKEGSFISQIQEPSDDLGSLIYQTEKLSIDENKHTIQESPPKNERIKKKAIISNDYKMFPIQKTEIIKHLQTSLGEDDAWDIFNKCRYLARNKKAVEYSELIDFFITDITH